MWRRFEEQARGSANSAWQHQLISATCLLGTEEHMLVSSNTGQHLNHYSTLCGPAGHRDRCYFGNSLTNLFTMVQTSFNTFIETPNQHVFLFLINIQSVTPFFFHVLCLMMSLSEQGNARKCNLSAFH